jgi:hypothetical protein
MNALILSTEVAKMFSHSMHLFYSIGPNMMFGCVLEDLENLRHVMRCKTFVSGLNALFWCTEVAEMVSHQIHPFYSIWTKMIFGCVLEHLGILGHVKRFKTCVWHAEVAKWFRTKCIHCTWTPNDVWLSFVAFRKPSVCKKCKSCVSGLNALFDVPKLWKWFRTKCIHSTSLDPKWSLVVFWSI